jgi:hypothetical protein
MIRCLVLTAAIMASNNAGADAPADATALFDQGIKDMRAGKTEVACKELSASLARYPDSGTKGALAECYTKLGKVASAWTLWHELADTVDDPDLKADAAKNADLLAPRLPHFAIKFVAPPPSGLTISVGGNSVADPTLDVPLPIDPGPFSVRTAAAGYEDWTGTFVAAEGQTTTIEVPILKKAASPTAGATKGTFGNDALHGAIIRIVSNPSADIVLDSKHVGTGIFEATVKPGIHELVVSAEGAKPYRTQVTLADNETRTIQIPLESEAASSEFGASWPVNPLAGGCGLFGSGTREAGYALGYTLGLESRWRSRINLSLRFLSLEHEHTHVAPYFGGFYTHDYSGESTIGLFGVRVRVNSFMYAAADAGVLEFDETISQSGAAQQTSNLFVVSTIGAGLRWWRVDLRASAMAEINVDRQAPMNLEQPTDYPSDPPPVRFMVTATMAAFL